MERSIKTVMLTMTLWITTGFANRASGQYVENRMPISTYNNADTALIMKWGETGYNLSSKNPDSALYWYTKALQLSREKGFPEGISYCLQGIGIITIDKGDLLLAEQYFKESIPYNKKLNSYKYLSATAYGNLGTLHYYQGDYKMAAVYYDSCIKASTRAKLAPESPQLLNTLNNLAGIYFQLNQMSLGIQYANQVELLSRKHDYRELLANALMNKGNIYSKLNEDKLALKYYKESLEICLRNHLTENGYAVLISLSELMLKNGKAKEAIDYLRQIHTQQSVTSLYNTLITKGYAMGKAYLLLKDYKNARLELEQAMAIAHKYNIKDGEIDAYKTLTRVYASLHQYEKAFIFQSVYEQLKDSILTRDKARDINELEIKYSASEKDLALAVRDKELAEKKLKIAHAEVLGRRKTTWIWISSLSSILLALVIILLRYRQSNREKWLEKQKEVELLRATMDGEEGERIRVGRELHDGVSGFLSAIKMNLITLRMQRKDISQELSYTNSLSLTDEAADELRKTAHNLVPSNLVHKGLGEAIKGFCERFSNPREMSLQVCIVGEPIRLNPEKELAVYRIAQELIHNIIKHAKASKVLLTISWHKEVLMISIEDNGIGMSSAQKPEGNGIGIDNIAKRIQSINGSLEIDSGEQEGTSMYLYFPLTA